MNTMAILLSDTYKQIHNKIYPKGLTKLVSYWTPRRSMLKNQNKMVFFGLQAFIEEYLVDYFNKNFFELTAAEVEHTYKYSMDIQLGNSYDLMHIDWVLMLYPRSGLGCKYGLNLMNQTGIVDSDFYYSDNEGHIFVKLKNNGDKECTIREGDNVVQGVFLEYGITIDDEVTGIRNGGFGSTTKNK